ncbi:hypothetical protein F5Y01DRAFT_316805 [Xylaria sp. FL0043]|nr:hypothetical protein F5Y01DRAFT_316805 [Xylaria sp. FL0043]
MPASNKPRSPTTPVSPPPRLHLRNILPASPEEPPIMPPPPRTPRAWVWQCHKCQSIYRLGCTRRCLDCSHTYCISNPRKQELYAPNPKKKQRRRQSGGLCGSEFDYVGWEQWGSWRRKVTGHEAAGRCETEARDKAFLKKRHNCWIDCDSPSECCHRRYELVASEALRIQEEREMEMQHVQELDDSYIPTEAVDDDGNGDGDVEAEESTTSSPTGQSSFLWDDDDDDENEREKTEEEQEEEERKWWAAITSIASGDAPSRCHDASCTAASGQIPGLNLTGDFPDSDSTSPDMDSNDWTNAVFGSIPSELQDRAGSRLTVRNSTTENDNMDVSSESEPESDGSGWSIHSSESDNSSIDAGSLGSSCPDVI